MSLTGLKELMSTNSAVKKELYWEQFSVLPTDLEHLANYFLETERPQSLAHLAQELIRFRQEQMVRVAKESLSQGRVYRPNEVYTVGERLLFPHLGALAGDVTQVRSGYNPEYAPFSVIQVQVEGGAAREFVAALEREHPLNTASYVPAEAVTVDELMGRHGKRVQAALHAALETSAQFLAVAHQWFLRDLVMEISPGQLNIAEAVLDMHEGGPVRTEAILQEIELPAEISRPLQLFSLEYALFRDRRFDEVGPAGYALWYLREKEPVEVRETPAHLHYMPIPYNRGQLDEQMLAFERQVDDEWSTFEAEEPTETAVSVILTYPHWRSGTLPLAARVSALFPTARITDRVRFTFEDGDTGATFPGWVVRSGRYVYGLGEWYAANDVGVGSYIDMRRGDDPGTIVVDLRRIRSQRREWLRTVTATEERLVFEVTRAPVSCHFDELATVAVSDPEAVDALAERLKRASLETLLEQVFGGLAGLSLQRAVHARSLYSVLNLLRRAPPAPLLAALAGASRYVSLGDNYWAYRGED